MEVRDEKKRRQHFGNGNEPKKLKRRSKKSKADGPVDEVIARDVEALLASCAAGQPKELDSHLAQPIEKGAEIEVEVVALSSTGDGLAVQKGSNHVYVVPFCVPGDTVKAKVFRRSTDSADFSSADFVSVMSPSPLRDDSRVRCKYFAKCSGCQFQMLDYQEQLRIKKRVVEKAYENFSRLPPESIPVIQETMGSPLQYGYRTKLTPHFDGPRNRNKSKRQPLEEVPPIGFSGKGKRTVMDIEDCPIGSDAVQHGLTLERERMQREFGKYSNGATILLRESTQRFLNDPDGASTVPPELPPGAVVVPGESFSDVKTCITDNNATSTEYIGNLIFTNPAGSFFQNNNSILPPFTDYVKSHILPPPSSPRRSHIKYLIDAYSGSGLFTITLASLLPGGSVGIDIADKSIAFARANARLNNLPPERASFVAADARRLFADDAVTFPAAETAVVLDPPRKGCDGDFLRQLLEFGPARVVYVSCNVHTQARDVGILVRGRVGTEFEDEDADTVENVTGNVSPGARYEIESLRGFDFFPQTSHVEGVAVLNRVYEPQESDATTG
jgi:tRNA (uracil-5-)-methyltransferase